MHKRTTTRDRKKIVFFPQGKSYKKGSFLGPQSPRGDFRALRRFSLINNSSIKSNTCRGEWLILCVCVCARVLGLGGWDGAIWRLDSVFGGGPSGSDRERNSETNPAGVLILGEKIWFWFCLVWFGLVWLRIWVVLGLRLVVSSGQSFVLLAGIFFF